ncbi:MAG: hypothetical protein QNJ97_22635 [Myxococcota bacterium]|nr:hypothetical protein [Myxococcota bacterium]
MLSQPDQSLIDQYGTVFDGIFIESGAPHIAPSVWIGKIDDDRIVWPVQDSDEQVSVDIYNVYLCGETIPTPKTSTLATPAKPSAISRRRNLSIRSLVIFF